MRFIRIVVASLAISLGAPAALAQNNEPSGGPARGSTMQQVEKTLGQPKQVLPAVGNPPITRWVYDAFTVYFEHDRVIHSVPNEKK